MLVVFKGKFLQRFLFVLCTAPLNYFQFISFSGGTHMGGIHCSTFPDTALFLFVENYSCTTTLWNVCQSICDELASMSVCLLAAFSTISDTDNQNILLKFLWIAPDQTNVGQSVSRSRLKISNKLLALKFWHSWSSGDES